MKKIALLLIVGLICMPAKANNYMTYCPQVPQKSNVTISKILGTNFLSQKIGESIIKKELKKETKGKFKVSLKSRSMGDLINGRFNSLSMVGKNLDVEGVKISKFSSKTLCGYNSVQLNKDSVAFRENMVLDYALEITDNDLEQTLDANGYLTALRNFKIQAGGFNLLKVETATVKIRENKLYFIFNAKSPMFAKNFPLVLKSDIEIKNGRLGLKQLQTVNTVAGINLTPLVKLLEKTSPIAFTSAIMDNENSKVSVDTIKIVNNVIVINGYVLIPKNVTT